VLTGVVRGERLAEEYANMDVFVFPSRTDTYGNAVAEALASGVPAVVMAEGGPKFLVENGVDGFVAESDQDFIHRVEALMIDPAEQSRMGEAARCSGCARSWDSVFENVYEAYRHGLATAPDPGHIARVNV
jgi:glycosyltransferase involved in cell wall biosynthesis